MKRKLLQIGAVALILLSFTVFDFSDTVEPDDSAESTLFVPTAAPEPVAATPNLDAAEAIYEQGICLEEYLAQYK